MYMKLVLSPLIIDTQLAHIEPHFKVLILLEIAVSFLQMGNNLPPHDGPSPSSLSNKLEELFCEFLPSLCACIWSLLTFTLSHLGYPVNVKLNKNSHRTMLTERLKRVCPSYLDSHGSRLPGQARQLTRFRWISTLGPGDFLIW